jgi:hypothetical protein
MAGVVEAEAAVRDLHARYADAIWRRDYAAAAACFTRDGEWRNGGLVLRGRGEIAAALDRFMVRFRRVFMTFRTPILSLAPAGAEARTYVTEQNVTTDGQGRLAVGVYYERIVLEDALWRREWALFQLLYRGPADLSGDFLDQPDFGPPPAMPPRDAPTFEPSQIKVLS